jgi:N-acetylmuramoyl-L-alanine amidase
MAKMASKWIYLIDPGHGGIVDGKYITPGKRSPMFPDGTQLFEGVNNRAIAKKVISKLKEYGFAAIDIVASDSDVSLKERVDRANDINAAQKALYISIHSDAAGDGSTWNDAKGVSVYTSPGQTKSDVFASILVDCMEEAFGSEVKFRKDLTDKDKDKEADFYVLTKTVCPSVLCELGFHTNMDEARRIQTEEWHNKVAAAIVTAVQKWEKL